MNFRQYGHLLRVPALRKLLLVAMLARIPHSASAVVLTLHVVNTLGLGYAAAGGVGAAVTVGIAFGGPWRGRLVDIKGLRRAMVPSIIGEVTVWTVAPFLNYQLLLIAAIIGGALAVPIFSVVRQALGVMVSTKHRRTAYALDSIGAELTFMIGPAAGVALATVNTVAAMIIIGAASSLAGLLLFWFNPPTRSGQPGSYQGDVEDALESFEELAPNEAASSTSSTGTSPLSRLSGRLRGQLSWITIAVLAVLAASVGVGMTLTGTDVGIVAVLREHDQQSQIGIVFIFWCAASIVGGLIYGSLHRKVNPLWLLAVMALLTVPMGFATETWALALLSIPAGLLCAPVLSASSEWVANLVPEARRGEAMGWYGSAITLGSAIGAPLAGAAIDAVGPWGGFAAVGVISTLLAVVGLSAQWLRRRRGSVEAY
ncbi:MFS transporter [Psychromicrobium lacuslunae]|uniref:MFS transporter n=1 Tax=Psychromicrobium lacuslunae TaxID=1618207 RepID=A0A0D4BWW1_9MICC|nr:MFS transporter [Psychromicrobium lacuslunae]AJT40600.1 MFS transporter [Psychromicrobium lacuslunae]